MLNLTSGSSIEQGAALVTRLVHQGGAALVPIPTSDAISDIRSEIAVDSDDDDEDMARTRRELALSLAAADRAARELKEAKQRRRKGTSIASRDSDRSRTRHEPNQVLGLSAALSLVMEQQGVQQATQAKETFDLVYLQPSQASASSMNPNRMQEAFNAEMSMASQAMMQKDINEAKAVEYIRQEAVQALQQQLAQAELDCATAVDIAKQQTADRFRQETVDYVRRETAAASQQHQLAEASIARKAQ